MQYCIQERPSRSMAWLQKGENRSNREIYRNHKYEKGRKCSNKSKERPRNWCRGQNGEKKSREVFRVLFPRSEDRADEPYLEGQGKTPRKYEEGSGVLGTRAGRSSRKTGGRRTIGAGETDWRTRPSASGRYGSS